MSTTNTQNKEAKATVKTQADFFQKCKGIALIIASSSLLLFVASLVMPADSVSSKDPYATTTYGVTTYNVEEGAADVISVPYTSIYDVTISDQQLLAVLSEVPPRIVTQVEKDLAGGATPNQFIMRCAYYNDNIMEDILNEVLGVTLAADWRTEDAYIEGNQAQYSSNGYGYNMYGDIED